MNGFKKFAVAVAVAAMGGLGGVALANPQQAEVVTSAASGVKYFDTLAQAKVYAKLMTAKGYFTNILKTNGGQYMVEYWTGH